MTDASIKKVKHLTQVDPTVDREFHYANENYRRDEFCATFFVKAFGIHVRAIYTNKPAHPSKTGLDWGATRFLLYMQNGNVVSMDNSEWASINILADRHSVSAALPEHSSFDR